MASGETASLPVATVHDLFVYPVKACRGISLKEVRVNGLGFEHDRMFCVVDLLGSRYPERQALSQRQLPALASICVDYGLKDGKQELILTVPGVTEKIHVPIDEKSYEKQADVLVECAGKSTTSRGGWSLGVLPGKYIYSALLSSYLNGAEMSGRRKLPKSQYVLVRALSSSAARTLSTYAGPVQAPYSPDLSKQREGHGSPFRMQDVNVKPTDRLYFQDMAPCNLASLDSLRALSQEMSEETGNSIELSIQCFRPNIIVTGGDEFSEENWDHFQIGDEARFRHLKLTPRCTVPSRNPTDGSWLYPQNKLLVSKVLKGMFPEKTKDREWEEQWQGPCFGVHIGCEEGLRRSKYVTMHVGDKVRVFSYRKLREDDSRIGIICTYMLSLIMTIFVVVLFIYAMRPHE